MATILRLAPQSAHRPKAPKAAAGGAEIIIFPGVRYERHGDAADTVSGSGARTRDRLVLTD